MSDKEDDDAKKMEKQSIPLKMVHLVMLGWFFQNHVGLCRHHCGTVSGLWSFVMITSELGVLVMHALGLGKTALLISVGEMAGGHFQHFFLNGYPTLLEGILSTFPGMNLYLMSASCSYFTSPYTAPRYAPSVGKWFAALLLGVAVTFVLMLTTAVLPAEAIFLAPVLYTLKPGKSNKFRQQVLSLLTAE